MFKTKKSPAVDAVEREIATLTNRLEKLHAARPGIERKAEEARKVQRAALAGADDAAAAKATATVRTLEKELSDTVALIADLEEAIEAAKERLEVERQNAVVADSAARLREIATRAGKHTATLDSALTALAEAAKGLLADLPEDVAIYELQSYHCPETRKFGPQHPAKVVSTLIAEGLDALLPEIFDQGREPNRGYTRSLIRFGNIEANPTFFTPEVMKPAKPLPAAMKALIVEKLKVRADAIEAGEQIPNLAVIAPVPREEPEPAEGLPEAAE